MATSHVTDSKFLQGNSDPLTLTITVGHTQAGGSYVLLITSAGSQEILPNSNGDYIIPYQPNSILSCVTTVQDISTSTNNTSVTHNFKIATPAKSVYTRTVSHHNDKVVYDIQYIFM